MASVQQREFNGIHKVDCSTLNCAMARQLYCGHVVSTRSTQSMQTCNRRNRSMISGCESKYNGFVVVSDKGSGMVTQSIVA